MKIFRSFEEAAVIRSPVVTTGSFDGVHIGHRTIIDRLNVLAHESNGESVVITFHPHPRRVLHPETTGKGLKLINTLEEKMFLLEEAGLDNVIIIEFTREFASVTSEEFVGDILTGTLGAKVIVVGFNHHFGRNKEGDYRQLWEWQEKYDFRAEEIPEQEIEKESVSSTKIREAISCGYIQKANAYLNHFYIVTGLRGPNRPSSYDEHFSSFELLVTDIDKLLPPVGFYAAKILMGEGINALLIIEEQRLIVIPASEVPSSHKTSSIAVTLHKQLYPPDKKGNSQSGQLVRKAIDDINNLIF